jgi:putative membrane protein
MTPRTRATLVSLAAATLFVSARPARAAQPTDTATVLKNLHDANQMEIVAGKLAEDKGQSRDVKKFGKALVSDHSSADRKVLKLAKDEDIDLPSNPMTSGEDMKRLELAMGTDFDRTFASEMLAGHQKVIADVKAALADTTDAKLKSLLTATLPVLEKHRQAAQTLLGQLGPSASAAGMTATPHRAP